MDTHRYLLDKNIVTDLIRHPTGPFFRHLKDALPAAACTRSIVGAKIRYGLASGAFAAIERRAKLVLGTMEVLPFEYPADEHYGAMRAFFKRTGQPIGAGDLFIATHASALNSVLVTAKVRKFERVAEMQVENCLGG